MLFCKSTLSTFEKGGAKFWSYFRANLISTFGSCFALTLYKRWIRWKNKIEILFYLSLYYTNKQTNQTNKQHVIHNEDHTGPRLCIPDREHPITPRSRRLVRCKRKAKVIHYHPALGERTLESYSNTRVLCQGLLREETTWLQVPRCTLTLQQHTL